MGKLVRLNKESVTNGAKESISFSEPYRFQLTIEGSARFLFHKWDCEAVDAKAKLSKNSKGKKEDNVESFVWRNKKGEICIPGEYVRQSLIHASKFKADPRSPRKSAMDLVKAGLVCLDELVSLGTKKWDFLDRRRVMVQRNAITRTRPGIEKGWEASFNFECLLPEYLDPQFVQEIAGMAGRLIGIGDFRPTFGRFNVVGFKIVKS